MHIEVPATADTLVLAFGVERGLVHPGRHRYRGLLGPRAGRYSHTSGSGGVEGVLRELVEILDDAADILFEPFGEAGIDGMRTQRIYA